MSDLRTLAANPAQYDSVGNKWLQEGAKDTPWRLFFKETLAKHLRVLDGLSVLDVGCGTGWMSDFVFKRGAKSYLGVEPSRLNFKTAQTMHKNANFINLAFEKFNSSQTFDLITCLMVSEHINYLDLAFVKWYKLLSSGGKLVIIASDFKAFAMEKFDYKVKIEYISDEEVVVQTHRPNSVDTVDIVRMPSVFLSAAKTAGFNKSIVIPLVATDSLIKLLPKYEIFRHAPIFQLLIFEGPRA